LGIINILLLLVTFLFAPHPMMLVPLLGVTLITTAAAAAPINITWFGYPS
jgi:hypothetical protein